MTFVDLAFNTTAVHPIPADHGYALYGAISRLLPEIHKENGIAVHPVRGVQTGDRKLQLLSWSSLTLRVPDGQIAPLLKLSGKSLNLDGVSIRVGVPQIHALVPVTALRSRLVLIKVVQLTSQSELTSEIFGEAVRKQLQKLDVSQDVIVTIGKRRTMAIKNTQLVGYEVILEGLSAEESIRLQEHGLGGKRHMGCGVLVEHKKKEKH